MSELLKYKAKWEQLTVKVGMYKTEQEQLDEVKKNHWSIQYIANPSKEVQLAAVRNYGVAIHYIANPSGSRATCSS